jgi:hypothetical protein
MMKRTQGILVAGLILFLSGIGIQDVSAGDFDGSKPLVCAMIEAFECGPLTGCESGTPESNGLSRFLRVDVSEKEVRTTKESQGRTSKIERVDHADGVLLLSGTQSGRGWTLSINESTGYMVLSVAGDQIAFVVFGACTRP